MINKRGEETRQLIKNCACALFASKGFKQVTMKDICEATKLSRGGLYCHYGSTQEIFKEIINDVLECYRKEMIDSQSSLSLAIYEYFSIEYNAGTKNELYTQYLASLNAWRNLMEYGIKKGEFNDVDIVSVFDLIVFSYQGARMYSKLIPIDEDIPQRIIEQIKKILVKE